MKKRIVLLLLAALMLCALAACGEEPETVSTPVPTPTPEATPSPTPSAGPLAEEEAAPAIISFSYESEILDSDGIIMLTVQSAEPEVRIPGNDAAAQAHRGHALPPAVRQR